MFAFLFGVIVGLVVDEVFFYGWVRKQFPTIMAFFTKK